MSSAKADFKVGDRVSHSKLGEGDILDLYPYGEDTVAVISFEKWGQKKIMLRYAELGVVEPPPEEEAKAAEEAEKQDKKPAKRAKTKKAASRKTKSTKKTKAKKAKKAKKKS
jgi:hypothetical protein